MKSCFCLKPKLKTFNFGSSCYFSDTRSSSQFGLLYECVYSQERSLYISPTYRLYWHKTPKTENRKKHLTVTRKDGLDGDYWALCLHRQINGRQKRKAKSFDPLLLLLFHLLFVHLSVHLISHYFVYVNIIYLSVFPFQFSHRVHWLLHLCGPTERYLTWLFRISFNFFLPFYEWFNSLFSNKDSLL
jgi:hypothetical protein